MTCLQVVRDRSSMGGCHGWMSWPSIATIDAIRAVREEGPGSREGSGCSVTSALFRRFACTEGWMQLHKDTRGTQGNHDAIVRPAPPALAASLVPLCRLRLGLALDLLVILARCCLGLLDRMAPAKPRLCAEDRRPSGFQTESPGPQT